MTKAIIHSYLRRSHRSVGVLLSIFLIILSVTGVLLNHTEDFSLSKSYVPSFIAARYYSDDQVLMGFQARGQYFYTLDGSLFVDTQNIGFCDDLKGLVALENQSIVLCGGELLILTKANDLVERLDNSLGLPASLQNIAEEKGRLVLIAANAVHYFDIDSLDISESTSHVEPMAEIVIPQKLALGHSISWQQFILDLHSGIILGNIGKLFLDLVSLCLCGMAVSGIAMWLRTG